MATDALMEELQLQKRTIAAYQKLVSGLRTNNPHYIKVAAHDIEQLEGGLVNANSESREVVVLREVGEELRKVVKKIEEVLNG